MTKWTPKKALKYCLVAEELKKEIDAAQWSEALGVVSDKCAMDFEFWLFLRRNGMRRYEAKQKKRAKK